MPQHYYKTKEASEITGASPQIIRRYTATYARYLSTEATPGPGLPRKFTASDLKLIAYVYQMTSQQNLKHEQVLECLAAGELEQFDWQVPEREEPAQADTETGTELVHVSALHAAQALWQDAQAREAQAIEHADELQERISELERELGKAQGALEAYKTQQRKPPGWWVKLFGGRGEE